MAAYRSWRDFDWTLLGLAVAISSAGVLEIFSATQNTVWKDAWWKQCVWIGAGLLIVWILAAIDYHSFLSQVPLLYGVALATLVATFFVGRVVFGSRRWIPLLGGFHFQTSEFVKVVIVLLIARYLTELANDRAEWPDLLKLGGLVAAPMALVMLQPDLGTALTYLPVMAGGIFIVGLRWQYWVAVLLILLLVLPFGWLMLKDYQKARLMTFMDPSRDPRGAGYQVIQSKIAVGSGGIWGKGVTRGSQTQLRFLPVPHTDFIMAAFAEEHGFIGVIVVVGLYVFLLMQIVQNAQQATDKAGMYICMGVCMLLLFHLLVNVGMVVGRMPVTGIPLPLMSYGGSSTLTMFVLLGLVNNVRLRRFVN